MRAFPSIWDPDLEFFPKLKFKNAYLNKKKKKKLRLGKAHTWISSPGTQVEKGKCQGSLGYTEKPWLLVAGRRREGGRGRKAEQGKEIIQSRLAL